MEITFNAESVSVDSSHGTSDIRVTVEASGRDLAERLDLDDRLYDLEPRDIIEQVGALKLLQAFDDQEITKWLQNGDTDPTDVLSAIGLDAIHDYLSHVD